MARFSIGGNAHDALPIAAGLHVVATPIGNLDDMTIRGLQTLAAADIVACEDKRISTRLLNRYAIRANLRVYHEHNADRAGPELLEAIRQGKSVALISDAGTPLISDPGYRLVKQAREAGLAIWPVPGPSAAIAALSASGMPSDRFLFEGFLPSKQGTRRARLNELAAVGVTVIFYESPKRLPATLADIADTLGEMRQICVCREITKRHEQITAGSASELAAKFAEGTKGEIVILAAPAGDDQSADPDLLLAELLQRFNVSRAAAEAAELTGLPRRQLYQKALQLKNRREEP